MHGYNMKNKNHRKSNIHISLTSENEQFPGVKSVNRWLARQEMKVTPLSVNENYVLVFRL